MAAQEGKKDKPQRAQSAKNIPITDLYQLSKINDTTWGIEGYEVPPRHVDARKQVQDREFSKGKKLQAPRALKRGHYLEDLYRSVNGLPGPKYNINMPWPEKSLKPPYATKKNSMIDQIVRFQQLNKYPAPNHYFKDLAEKQEKKIKNEKNKGLIGKGGERANFLCECEYLGNDVPGPGSYEVLPKKDEQKKPKLRPSDWQRIHSAVAKREKTRQGKEPDPASYNPFPASFSTFGRALREKEDKGSSQKSVGRVQYFGTAARFSGDPKPGEGKKKKRPMTAGAGPGQYDVTSKWLTADGKDKKDKDILHKVVRQPPSKSLYYDD